MSRTTSFVSWLLGIVGGAVGGAIGYFLFFAIVRQGFYALALPGALLGLGCTLCARTPSNALGIACGVFALILGIGIEWNYAPFRKDESLAFFVTHLFELKPVTLIMIALGSWLGYWFGKGTSGGYRPGGEPARTE